MDSPSAVQSTFVIERSYPKPPEKVFAAFADPEKKRRWYAEGWAHDVVAFNMDFRVDGKEQLSARLKEGTPFPGVVIDWRNIFQDIVPNRRIVISQSMDFGNKRVSVALITIELLKTEKGTDLICTHHGAFFENSGGPEMREAGWKSLFDSLGRELDR